MRKFVRDRRAWRSDKTRIGSTAHRCSVIDRVRRPRRRSAALAVLQIDAIPLIFGERVSASGTAKYHIQNRQPGYGRSRVNAGLACARAQGNRLGPRSVSTDVVERIRVVGDRRGYSSKLTASENAVKSRRNPILIMKCDFMIEAGSPRRKMGGRRIADGVPMERSSASVGSGILGCRSRCLCGGVKKWGVAQF